MGRVCFHLAENKNDDVRPFAFMATYASGFGASGRVKHLPLRRALQQYAGARNRAALIKLLSPIEQAGETCAWVRDLVDSGRVYQPMAWSAERAYELLRSVPALEGAGLSVRLPNWWRKRARPQVAVTIGGKTPAMLGAGAMLDFKVEVALGGEPLSRAEREELLAGSDDLVLLKGQWVEVDRDKLRQAIDHWDTLRQAGNGGVSFIDGMRLLAGASADLRHEDRAEDERGWVHVTAGDAMREILAGMRRPGDLEPVAPGGALRGTLRPYQRDGVAWLRFLTGLGLGACLADDMGLGKTIQVLSLAAGRQERPRPRGPVTGAFTAGAAGLASRPTGSTEIERGRAFALEASIPAPSSRVRTDPSLPTIAAEDPRQGVSSADRSSSSPPTACCTRQPWLLETKWRSGDSRRSPGHQEPVDPAESGRPPAFRPRPHRADGHPGGEPSRRPVVPLRLSQPRPARGRARCSVLS